MTISGQGITFKNGNYSRINHLRDRPTKIRIDPWCEIYRKGYILTRGLIQIYNLCDHTQKAERKPTQAK